MPRPIALANGRLYVAVDGQGRIRDLTYPHVGQLNHLVGHAIRAGVWHDGRFSWLDSEVWNQEQVYVEDTLTAITSYTSIRHHLHIEFEDTVLRESDVMLRRIRVQHLGGVKEEVRLFFTHDLRIAESDIGDTALYHPISHSMIHYKRQFAFAFGARFGENRISQYSTGIKAFNGFEGTWRDAEDGELHMTPIDQGSVDSTFRIDVPMDEIGKAEGFYWICAARSMEAAADAAVRLQALEPGPLMKADHAFWRSWVHDRTPDLSSLPENIQSLYKRSLLLLTTQIDSAGGILAATDSDIMRTARAHYSYVWPRDGALVAHVLDRAGEHERSREFFEFCKELLTPARSFFLQKYGPDGSLGASWHPWVHDGEPEVPLQQDETALTVYAIANHMKLTGDETWLKENWASFIEPMAEFLMEYRDGGTLLPLPSYDLWEERRGVHAFTVASVIGALRGASEMARRIGDPHAEKYADAAKQMRESLDEHLYDPERKVYLRGLGLEPEGVTFDRVADASLLQLALLGAVESDSKPFLNTLELVKQALWVDSKVGGLARYTGDYYFRSTDAYPGNPWAICTLWLAQAYAALGRRNEAVELLSWCVKRAETTGVLAEQFHPETGEPLSVSPLTWSHAEFVKTCLDLVQPVRS